MDSSPSCDRIVLRFHSIFLYMKETTSKRTNSLHSFLLKYILYTTNIFSIFQANTSGVARKEDWGWPALGGPGSVQSQDIQRVEMSALPTEPSLQPAQLYSDGVSAYDGDDLVLKTHDRRTLSIDLPTRITIPIFHRLRLNQFLRKRGNNVVLELVCTQSGRAEQLSAPTEYMVKNDVTFSIV